MKTSLGACHARCMRAPKFNGESLALHHAGCPNLLPNFLRLAGLWLLEGCGAAPSSRRRRQDTVLARLSCRSRRLLHRALGGAAALCAPLIPIARASRSGPYLRCGGCTEQPLVSLAKVKYGKESVVNLEKAAGGEVVEPTRVRASGVPGQVHIPQS